MSPSWSTKAIRFLAAFLVFAAATFAQPSAEPSRILVLFSYHRAAWSDSVLAGIERVFPPGKVELDLEYMDTKKNDSPEYVTHLADIYRVKYSGNLPDAAILVDDKALQFFLHYRDSLFGGIPAAFAGVNEYQEEMLAGAPRITGVVERGDYLRNLQLLFSARPHAKRLLVITDSTGTGQGNLRTLTNLVKEQYPAVKLVPILQRGLPALDSILTSASPEDVAFFLAYWRSPDGQPIRPSALESIFRHSRIPVFGRSEWMLGLGLTGGMCVIGGQQGQEAAQRLQQMLTTGTTPPVLTDSPNRFLFDARELKRHGLAELSLPENSLLMFERSSTFKIDRWILFALFSLIVLLATLTGMLLWNQFRRSQLTKRLLQSEERYRILVENQTDLVVKVNAKGQFLFASPSYLKFFGVSLNKLLGQEFLPRVLEEDREQTLRAMEALKEPPHIAYMEQRVETPIGLRWLGWNDRAILNKAGQITAIIGVGRDITDRKADEALREQLIHELGEKNNELERYAYTVSHDLRSPLMTMLGFAGEMKLSLEEGDKEGAHEAADRITKAAKRMGGLLEGLLRLSKVGKVSNPPTRVDLAEVMEEVKDSLHGPLLRRSCTLEVIPTMPVVWGDPHRLQEVLQNLVENAIKYMGDQPTPSIRVTSTITRAGQHAVITVTDNGMGIDPLDKQRLFALFHKVDQSSEGAGVGLALVKRIVEHLGGRVWVDSAGIGQGSAFSFTVPLPK